MQQGKIRSTTAAWSVDNWTVKDGCIVLQFEGSVVRFHLEAADLPDGKVDAPLEIVLKIPMAD